jgi:hypothetical protein
LLLFVCLIACLFFLFSLSSLLSFKIDGVIKVLHDNQKLKQYITTKLPRQKILQGILHTECDSKQNHERAGSTKLQKKKKQKVENNIDLASHKQTLK